MSLNKWVQASAESVIVRALKEAILNMPLDRNLIIWGASVRGAILGFLLEKQGYTDFEFIDNDSTKKGSYLGGHFIWGSDEIEKWNKNEYYILIPIEYGFEVAEQLDRMGFVTGDDYLLILSQGDGQLVEELLHGKGNERLFFGDSLCITTSLFEDGTESLFEMLRQEKIGVNAGFLGLSCLSLPFAYELLRVRDKYVSKDVKEVYIFVSNEMMEPWDYMLSRTQHTGLLHKLKDSLQIIDDELDDYIRVAEARASNYEIENRYSPTRTNFEDREHENSVDTEYATLALGTRWSIFDISVLSLQRILLFCRQKKIRCVVVMLPLNIDAVKKMKLDVFETIKCNETLLKMIVENESGEYVDLSHNLSEEDFEMGATISDCFRNSGVNKIILKLRDYSHGT